jgi:dihydrofolate synthase/folylpolyglutamate synthase
VISAVPPKGSDAIERFLLEELPAAGPPPRGEEGLARARRFFARAGDPQDSTRQIHVVGTAGKGTAVGAIIGHLVGAGATVGAHLSPHVYDLRERFLFNGQLPHWDEVDAAVSELWPTLVETTRADGRPPSFFEMTTAVAWVIGRRGGAHYLVTEAGIGGEFDATNSISRPDKLTVIMPIGFDHLEILGSDLRSIAANKAAVITPGGRVVVAPQRRVEAMEVVRDVAAARNAELIEVTEASSWVEQATRVAETVLEALEDPSLSVGPEVDVHLPGRMETLDAHGRRVILDGAHNPMKLRGVREALGDAQPSVLVAALSQEKDLEACAAELARVSNVIVASDFTLKAGNRVVRRSWSSVELARALKQERPDVEVHVVPDVEAAMIRGIALADHGDVVLATGSFMILEDARAAAVALGARR